MPTTTYSQALTLTTGTATTLSLRRIFTGSTVTYRQGQQDNLAWTFHTATGDIPEWEDYLTVNGDEITLTAPDQTYRQFYILLWYFTDPEDILRINVTDVVLPVRDPLMPNQIAMADIRLLGVGSAYDYPTVDFFPSPHTSLTPTISGNTSLVTARRGGITAAQTAPAGSPPAIVTVGSYSFNVTVTAPLLADDQVAVPGDEQIRAPSAETVYLSPSGQITIPPGVIFAAIPDQYKEGILESNVITRVLQGREICDIVTAGIIIGRAGTATDARNYSVSIRFHDSSQTQSTSLNNLFYTWRFYVSVTNMEGRPAQNPFPPFLLVPNENPTTGGNTIPGNPPPLGSTLYRAAVHPPPVRDDQLIERKFSGELPDRLSNERIGVVVGQIDQEGTATTIGLADPRRQQKVPPQHLTGGIYDVPRVIPDDFWVEWPHNVREENA